MTDDPKRKRIKFKKHDVLLREGETGDAAFLIVSGEVEVRKGAFGKNPKVLATLGKGNVVGEMALFDDHPHSASVIAVVDTEVTTMPKAHFQKLVGTMDPVMKAVVGVMVRRLRQVVNELVPKVGEINWVDWRE